MSVRRLSGLQKDVLHLQRQILRAIRQKGPEGRGSLEEYVRAEFKRNAKAVDRKDFQSIEYLLRKGHRQLEQYLKQPEAKGITIVGVKK